MPDTHFDQAFRNSGTAATATISGTPSGLPRFAMIASINKNGLKGGQPDASWSAAGTQWGKIFNSAGLLTASQSFPAGPWAQALLFFGSDGILPAFSTVATASTSNPGNGAFLQTAGLPAISGGLDLLLVMLMTSSTGFFHNPEDYNVTDSLGNSYSELVNVAGVDGSGNGAQVIVFGAANVLGSALGWTMKMTQLAGDPAHNVSVTYFFYSVTDLIAVGGLRLLASLGVGV